MDISIQTLHKYVEKIAKKVLNDESGKPVISGTIKASVPGIYEVQLVNGNETSLVRAESLYADKTFAVDDYVYLVRAENNRGDEYETKYFIVGLVTTVEQNFANLTEWERFLGDGQKITSTTFNEKGIITILGTGTDTDRNFINAVRANGVFSFSAKVTTNITKQTDFGFKFTFAFDDDSTKEEIFPGTTFVGQPWSLSEVTQKKIFNLGTQNTLKSITVTKVEPNNGTFDATDISLESGTFLDLAQDFKVTLENVNGKNYFNKSTDDRAVQIKANVNYGNQKLDTKALKYYWFVKLDDEYYLNLVKSNESFKKLLEDNGIDLSEIYGNIIKNGQINKQVLEEILKENDSKEAIIYEISVAWFEVRTKQINENSLGGVGWKCLNDFNYAKIIDENGITERKDVLIYKTDDNILEITYEDANTKNWLPHYENEIKCVVGYQLANATSEPIKIYNFNHESYEVTIEFSDNTELPLLYLEETARINATLNQKLVGLTANDIYYRWYLNDETEPLSYIKETEDDDGNVKEETIYYSGSSLVIGYPEKSSKEVYRLNGEYGNFTCKVFKNDGSNEVIADAPPALRVWSAIAADKQLKEEKHYVYWLDVANNLRFSPFEENAKIQNEIDTKYIIYKANGEIPGAVAPGIDESAFDWLNGSAPFTEDGVYYLYYSEQVQVKSTLESNPNVVYRYNDFSNPQILRYIERKTENGGEIKITDLLNVGKVEQLNTFNRLSNNGLSDGIYYEDAGYGKTMDTAPDSNKLTTGKGYYKKVDTYEYQKVDIDKFEENKDYYIKKANGEYEKNTDNFDKEKEYYIRHLIKTEYILREENSDNYEIIDGKPQNFLSNEEYYEQVEGGDLYINASFIRSGHLEVSDGTPDGTVFSADIDNKTVKIGGFHVTKDYLSSGEITGDQKVLMSPGYKDIGEQRGKFVFWAGEPTEAGKDSSRPFWVSDTGEIKATKLVIQADNVDGLEEIENELNNSITSVQTTANNAQTTAETAQSAANSAQTAANNAQNTANSALTNFTSTFIVTDNIIYANAGKTLYLGSGGGQGDLIINTGALKFNINNNKKLEIIGDVTATGGSIGGFHIVGNHLANGNTDTPTVEDHTVLLSGSGVAGSGGTPFGNGDFVFWAGTGNTGDSKPFWVKKTGEIKATGGTIGGWTIGVPSTNLNNIPIFYKQIYKTDGTKDISTGMAALNNNDHVVFWAGCPGGTPWEVTGYDTKTPFYVTSKGFLFSKSGKIAGFDITENSIKSSNNNIILNSDGSAIFSNDIRIQWKNNNTVISELVLESDKIGIKEYSSSTLVSYISPNRIVLNSTSVNGMGATGLDIRAVETSYATFYSYSGQVYIGSSTSKIFIDNNNITTSSGIITADIVKANYFQTGDNYGSTYSCGVTVPGANNDVTLHFVNGLLVKVTSL